MPESSHKDVNPGVAIKPFSNTYATDMLPSVALDSGILSRNDGNGAIMRIAAAEPTPLPLSASQIEDLKLASAKMLGAERRSFHAAMVLKYCGGSARQAERVFGWGRDTVQLGLHELRAGVVCLGAQAAYCGNLLWEERHPEVAAALFALAESNAQQDPTFRPTLAYTRLTAEEALRQLRSQGFGEGQLP